jgi:hypothetical protein
MSLRASGQQVHSQLIGGALGEIPKPCNVTINIPDAEPTQLC